MGKTWKDKAMLYRYVTPEQLDRLVPGVNCADTWALALDDACRPVDFPVDEFPMLLAQLGHESHNFNRLVENLNYSSDALILMFGRHRITVTDANKFGRGPGRVANQQEIANTLYGGDWGRKNLGNQVHGDGWRYRGRGLIHTTGRANYQNTSNWLEEIYGLKVDLAAEPDRLTEPDLAAKAAIAFWENRVRPATTLREVTKRINGGTNGIEDRKARYDHIMRLWGKV